MTTLTCPKCRQGMSDAALDVGQCPACGFPLDGPLVLDGAPRRHSPALLVAVAGALVVATGVAGYAFLKPTDTPAADREVAREPDPEPPAVAVRHVAPFPHLPQPRDAQPPNQPPKAVPVVVNEKPPQPAPVIEPPKHDGPRPIGVVMKVDPKIAPKRHFDSPHDTAALPDLNSGDRVTLTGKLRVLRIGSVNGSGSIDASGLVAEEIVITGDLNGEAVVTLNAPGGKVTIGGYVVGSTKLTVIAPNGEVRVPANSGLFAGSSTTRLTARRVEIAGKLGGGAKVFVTFTAGGSLKFAAADEGAIVTYKKAAPSDPPVTIEKGTVRGGAKVIAE